MGYSLGGYEIDSVVGTRMDLGIKSVENTDGESRGHRTLRFLSAHPTNFASFRSRVSVICSRTAPEDEGHDSTIEVLIDAGETFNVDRQPSLLEDFAPNAFLKSFI